MKAFHSDKEIKKKYVNRVMAHQKADRIVQGIGWKNGKGCADAAAAYADAARRKEFIKFADKLLELIKECK